MIPFRHRSNSLPIILRRQSESVQTLPTVPAQARAVILLQQFNGLASGKFFRALNAERVPCGGYQEQYFDGLLDQTINSRGFKRLLSAERLKACRHTIHGPKSNRHVCATTGGMTRSLLLGDRSHIAVRI